MGGVFSPPELVWAREGHSGMLWDFLMYLLECLCDASERGLFYSLSEAVKRLYVDTRGVEELEELFLGKVNGVFMEDFAAIEIVLLNDERAVVGSDIVDFFNLPVLLCDEHWFNEIVTLMHDFNWSAFDGCFVWDHTTIAHLDHFLAHSIDWTKFSERSRWEEELMRHLRVLLQAIFSPNLVIRTPWL